MRRLDLSKHTEKKQYMSCNSFLYWLQGWIEIAQPEQIGKKEVIQIKNHINIVADVDKNGFIWFLSGMLECRSLLNKEETLIVKKRLSTEFLKITPENKLSSPSLLDVLNDQMKRNQMIPMEKGLLDKVIC